MILCRCTDHDRSFWSLFFFELRGVPALQKFETAMDASMFLLKELKVATVPGDNFYNGGHNKDYIRFCF